MFYLLFYPLHEIISFFNIFRYLTFRSVMATITAFLVSVIFGPFVIKKITQLSIGQHIRKEDSATLYQLHKNKQGTPTMGGILILFSIFASTLLWADLTNKQVVIVVIGTLWLGITGFIDDYLKHIRKCSNGLTATAKLLSQLILGLLLGIFLYFDQNFKTFLDVPFFKNIILDLGYWYILLIVLVVVGTSNAVNLTDGLDGLAIGSVVFSAIPFSVLCYVSGNSRFSEYLLIPYIKGAGELTVFCASIIGAGLGFLWFNCYPASIFMGDVGSLALGGALGIVAILIKKELLLVFVGGIFVAEAFSVLLQVIFFKLTKKRIFKCSPLHHHFQFLGWHENKVIVRFWIVSVILALLALVTLKIR
ncbi:MAG: phospho-N-acetylmuramoyl-pentapeptide-transferase [Candidatus Omnitrophica bacterium]|nr:phospho-N-acetylmuramoyl-pentapeptide-transferase [Candidatus Omnitrophota bacterium]